MLNINRYKLSNGLRVVHSPDINTKMVALNMLYDVGARDEDPDHTGFAHLFEHLMFGGSLHIPEFDTPLQLAGGENNAWTTNDITNYYITLPKQNIETGFWLESDRMLGLDFNAKSLEVQRGVVMEEFKQRSLNQPYGDVGHLIRAMVYEIHPYRWPTIGLSLDHIAQATLEEVESFFYRFYAPNNAILSVTGNITFKEVVALCEKWFGEIPLREVPERKLPKEPIQTEERRQEVVRDVPVDALFINYPMCEFNHSDYKVYDLISDVLSNGTSSRLKQHLTHDKKIFSSIDAYVSGSRDAGMFQIVGQLADGVSLEEGESEVQKELEVLQNELIPQEELEKVKNKFESSQVFRLIDYLNLANDLAWYELNGNAEEIEQIVPAYRSVTAEQTKSIAQKLFDKNKRSILYYKKK